MKLTVFSAHKFEQAALEATAKIHKVELNLLPVLLNKGTLALANGSEVISLFVNDDASAEVLEGLYEIGVRAILLRSAGYNHVDLKKAKELGLFVANVPEYSPYAVAEHAVALMMTLNRKIIKAHNRVNEGNFALDGLTGFDFHGKTVGIIGMGKIGKKVANIMIGMGCEVLAVDPVINPLYEQIGIRYVTLIELLKYSDIISLHAPLTLDNKHIINEQSLSLMKDGVMLINTSRGALVDTKAVIKGLKSKKIAYLGLDVYEEEKGLFFEDHSDEILQDDDIARLITFPNVIITSHQAFLTHTALKNIADTTFDTLECYRKGEGCKNKLA